MTDSAVADASDATSDATDNILDVPESEHSSPPDAPKPVPNIRKDSLRSAKNRPKLVLKKNRMRGDRDFIMYNKGSKLYTLNGCLSCCSPDSLVMKMDRIARIYDSSVQDDCTTVEWNCGSCGERSICGDSRIIDKHKRI